MKLISPGSRVKFYTVKLINTKFQITFLSGTVHEDNGNYVTVWTDDSRTFHVPHEYITEIPPKRRSLCGSIMQIDRKLDASGFYFCHAPPRNPPQ